MSTLSVLIRRNTKLFFKDKGLFFTALITPMILLVLYATFLGNVYRDAFLSGMPEGVVLDDSLVGGFVGGQLISSILAVSCVTVAFCSNMLMVQDKANGTLHDLTITPVSHGTLALSYYLSTLISTLCICFTATALCLIYVSFVGWYLSVVDVLLLFLDVLLLSVFVLRILSYPHYVIEINGLESSLIVEQNSSVFNLFYNSGYLGIKGVYYALFSLEFVCKLPHFFFILRFSVFYDLQYDILLALSSYVKQEKEHKYRYKIRDLQNITSYHQINGISLYLTLFLYSE